MKPVSPNANESAPGLRSTRPSRAHSLGATGHDVLFYGTSFPAREVGDYCRLGLAPDSAVMALATTAHLALIRTVMMEAGVDVSAAEVDGQVVFLSVEEALAVAHVGGVWNDEGFDAFVAERARVLLRRFPKLRVYGEMVEVLCTQNRAAQAVELEATWNRLRHPNAFELLCSYSLDSLERASASGHGVHLCAAHADVRFAAG